MALQTKHFYAFGPFRLDSAKRVLVRDGTPVSLAPKAAEALLVLVENAGRLVDKDDLMKRVWPDAFVEEGNLNKNIFFLRKVLGEWDRGREYIETVPKRGFRFLAPVTEVTHAEGDPQSQPAASANLIGRKVSHYRVLEVIGGGGMGLVYKAEDLKLGRRVALKFLPEEVATDSLALQRFEREARTASSLNHSNICTIYEIEEYESQPFIVMELLEGETLRDRLASSAANAVPLDQLLSIALQICEGLQAAHQKGIIHRDIKPANIFLTAQGPVKILDFGLAKLVEAPAVEAPGFSPAETEHNKDGLQPRPDDLKGHGFSRADTASASELRVLQPRPGLEHARNENNANHNGTPEGVPLQNGTPPDATLTRTGAAMGTAGYMSPEQVRGEKLDARTDLFSFGLVLYEMATGQRAFSGNTAAILKDSILNNTPAPVRELKSTLPPKLEQVIDKAIEKDRERRYQSAQEVRADLQSLTLQPSSQTDIRGQRHHPRWPLVAAALGAVVVAAAVMYVTALRQPPPRPGLKQTQLTANSSANPVGAGAISPDGKYLAYSDKNGTHIKLLETGETQDVPEPEGLKGS